MYNDKENNLRYLSAMFRTTLGKNRTGSDSWRRNATKPVRTPPDIGSGEEIHQVL
jgi:hypothetical protein